MRTPQEENKMAPNKIYETDALIMDKICSREWIAEPSTGKIFSRKRCAYVKPFMTKKGYLMVNLKKGVKASVSRVIWLSVHGVPEIEGLVIDHINEIKTDNRLENLRLLTSRGNCCRSFAKVTYEAAEKIRMEYAKGGISYSELGMKYRMSRTGIENIVRGERHKPLENIDTGIPVNVKQKIFEDICLKGCTLDEVTEKYSVSVQSIISAVEEQSLKLKLTREVNS